MEGRITVTAILQSLTKSSNPFDAVRGALRKELFAEPSREVRIAIFCALGVLGLSFLASLGCILVRGLRRELWLYRLSRAGGGLLIVPNTLLLWLGFHVAFVLAAFPYVLLGSLKITGSLSSIPIWSALIFVADFLALWHVAWGTSVSLFLQSIELGASASRSLTASRRVRALALNLFFVGGALAGTIAMLALTARKTVEWNEGVDAFSTLDTRLLNQALAYDGTAPVSSKRGGIIILDAIPNANKLLDRMSLAFRGFESPYWICATFSTLAALVAAVACFVQVRRINTQVQTRRSIGSQSTLLASSSSSAAFRPTHQKSDSDSSTTPMLSKKAIREPSSMQQTYKRVVLVLIALAGSGLTYAALCLVGDYAVSHSRIFEMSSSNRLHLYLYMFAFTPFDAIVTTAIVFHTFFSRSSSPSPASSLSKSSFASPPPLTSSSPTRPAISSPIPRSPDIASIHEPEMSDIGCETAMLARLDYVYEGETAGRMSFERPPRRAPSLLPGMRISL